VKTRKIDLNSWRLNQCTNTNNEAMEPTSIPHEQSLQEQLLQAYYQQLTPFEQRTCDIARDHLGSSFDLARSNGFLRWRKT
jgi:hypothetical protein